MKKIYLLLLVMCAFAACENGGGDTPKNITITGGSTNQTVYADEIQKTDGIKFTATEDWTATVNATATKTAGSNVDWLKLSQYEGGAGDFSLSFTLLPNDTGKDRKATIKIICGDTTITITVEQKGFKKGEDPTPEEPEKPEDPDPEQPDNEMLISKIVVKEKISDGSYKYLREADFTYDEQKRLVKVVSSKNGSADQKKEFRYDYVTNKMTSTFQEGNYSGGVWLYEQKDVIDFSLNADGYVISADGKMESKQNGVLKRISEYTNRFTYTDDGYVATLYFHQISSNADGSDRYEDGLSNSEYVWTEGNMMYQQERDSKVEYSEWEYNNLINNSNLDFNYFISPSDDLDYTTAFTKLGKRSKNRLSKIHYSSYESAELSVPLISSIARSQSSSDNNVTVTYETDSQNGAVTKFYVTYNNKVCLYEITYIKK